MDPYPTFLTSQHPADCFFDQPWCVALEAYEEVTDDAIAIYQEGAGDAIQLECINSQFLAAENDGIRNLLLFEKLLSFSPVTAHFNSQNGQSGTLIVVIEIFQVRQLLTAAASRRHPEYQQRGFSQKC